MLLFFISISYYSIIYLFISVLNIYIFPSFLFIAYYSIDTNGS
jgi:hypothetical protein